MSAMKDEKRCIRKIASAGEEEEHSWKKYVLSDRNIVRMSDLLHSTCPVHLGGSNEMVCVRR